MIGRRQLPAVFAALVAPRISAAQTGRWQRLAIMTTAASDAEVSESASRFWRAFFGELRLRGFQEARNLVVERWSGRGNPARYGELSLEVASSTPDVVYVTSMRLAQALQAATTSIPVVVGAANMVGTGLADSMARPGRNVTGFSLERATEVWVKGLELLREAVPTLSKMALLVPRSLWEEAGARQMREIAPRIGVTLIGALMNDPIQPPEYQRVVAAMIDQGVEALIVGDVPENFMFRHLIVELAATNRLPMIAPWRELAELGALMSYGMDLAETGRNAAGYVARIMQGEKPAHMPIRLIDKFELVINARAASVLGLTIPPSILARADEAIE